MPAKTITPDELIRQQLEILDGIEDERAALVERRKGALAPLFDELSLSKRAVKAFLQRRNMTEEDQAQFDQDFAGLCQADNAPFQPDLFDELFRKDRADQHDAPARTQ
jgi:hypothetical protein